MRRLNILVWHIHGSYLNTLARIEHNWYLPVTPQRGEGYGGRGPTFDLPGYVREVPAEQVRELSLDVIIFQTPRNYQVDQFEILSAEQRRLPKIYIEHNSPQPHPCNSQHVVDDPEILLVHVTHFNRLMWDNNRTPTTVIEHSVAIDPRARYTGERPRGISAINGIRRRSRIAGYDIFMAARENIPLDLVGMQSEELGGLGDVPYRDLHRRLAEYRFLFSPMRYTSLPLAVIEGMTLGMPIVALATTELPMVIENGKSGFVSCDVDELIEGMRFLVQHPESARSMGEAARRVAAERFGLERFAAEWNRAFAAVLASGAARALAPRSKIDTRTDKDDPYAAG